MAGKERVGRGSGSESESESEGGDKLFEVNDEVMTIGLVIDGRLVVVVVVG